MEMVIYRVDGTSQTVPDSGGYQGDTIRRLIGADSLDTVNLRDGRTMYVDDLGHQKGLPVNQKGTQLYHAICRPGTTHVIVGDVVVVRD